MRTIQSLSLGAVAVLALATAASAQSASSPILNTLEVQRLVANADSADNAKLGAHFAALAARDSADAQLHDAMSQSFGGNPSRQVSSGMSLHCKRLADLDRQSAATLRELAAHYDRRAAGVPSTPPAGSAGFEAGAGAPAPTQQELSALAAGAHLPAEHRALAEYFLTLEKRYTTEARDHAALAGIYRGTRLASAAISCDRLVKLSQQAATEARVSAAMHNQLAAAAR
jgi:hypothetical protein